MALKSDTKFKGKLTHGLKNHMRAVENLKICILMGYF